MSRTFLLVLSLAVTAVPAWPQSAPAQSLEAMEASGVKMAFDVASVKLDKAADSPHSNFPLGPGDSYSSNGGLFTATDSALSVYIGFAYKLTPDQVQALQSQLPKWANEDRFDIQARTGTNATKDQMRMMMQSLLADRFKLAVHRETRQLPVFALVLVKPGKTGPQLHPHSPDSSPCAPLTPSRTTPAPTAAASDGYPAACGVFLTQQDVGRTRTSARSVTIRLVASSLTAPGMEPLGRPVVDETGLGGTFDFTLEWAPAVAPGPDAKTDESVPTFLEALKDQLGLRLEPQKRPINVLVIDHVEQPTEN